MRTLRSSSAATGSLATVVALVLATGAAATTVSACSAEELSDRLTKAQYLVELRAVVNKVREDSKLIDRALSLESPAQLQQLIDDAATELDEVAADLEDLNPPEEIAAVHDQLVGVVSDFSGLFSNANQDLQAGDIAGLLELIPQAEQVSADFNEVTQEFSAQGYQVDEVKPISVPPQGTAGTGAPQPQAP